MTLRQYIAVSCAALFSPLSRLLPQAAVEAAGMSGWLGAAVAFPALLGLVWAMDRLLTVEGEKVGLCDALCARLGIVPGRLLAATLGLWLVFYGGFILRSGAERLLSTIYPSGSLPFFLLCLLVLSTLFAMGSMRAAGRTGAVVLLLFLQVLAVVLLTALPTLKADYIWPPTLRRWQGILLSGVPVLDVLSPWVWFTFLRGSVTEDDRCRRRVCRAAGWMCLMALCFLLTTIGLLGPRLSRIQQFPFFVMVKNLKLFHVLERFDALVVMLWVMTDYVCIGMLLLSAGEALRSSSGTEKRNRWVLPCAGGMLLAAWLSAPDAFRFQTLSARTVPVVNLLLVLLLLLASFLPSKRIFGKFQKRC